MKYLKKRLFKTLVLIGLVIIPIVNGICLKGNHDSDLSMGFVEIIVSGLCLKGNRNVDEIKFPYAIVNGICLKGNHNKYQEVWNGVLIKKGVKMKINKY